MNKRAVYLGFIAVLFIAVAVNTSHQIAIWGFDTVTGGDELAHFSRARAIAQGFVDVYHEYDNPKYYDFYPAGFHVLAAQFIELSGFPSHYDISFVFKTVFAVLTTVLVFLIGARIDRKVGLFSAFFFATYFRVFTWTNPFYINITSPQNTFGSVFISTPMIFFTILLYLMFLKSQDNEIKYGALIVIAGTVHGISHISTYIGFLLNFTGFSAVIMTLILLRYRQYFTKMLNIALYTFFSIPLVFFIYYYPMYPEILTSPYVPEEFFPSFIPSSAIPYFPALSSVALAFIIFSLLLIRRHFRPTSISYINTDRRMFLLAMAIYIMLYSAVLFLVSRNPLAYPRSGRVILIGIFPTYIPRFYPGFIPTVSLLIGFSMFFLTLFSFLWARNSKFINFNFIFIMYIVFYMVWFASAIIIQYYPNRIIYFQFILPFIYATGLAALFTRSRPRRKNLDKKGKKGRPLYETLFQHRMTARLKKGIAIAIVFMVLSTSVMSQITKDPELRRVSASPVIDIGKQRPTRADPSLSVVVNRITDPGDYILSTPESLEVMATTTHIRSPTNHWSQTYTDHVEWGIVVRALKSIDTPRFYDTYDSADYLVVSYGDIYGGTELFGYGNYHSPDIYSRNPNYVLVYQDQYNERIYLYVG